MKIEELQKYVKEAASSVSRSGNAAVNRPSGLVRKPYPGIAIGGEDGVHIRLALVIARHAISAKGIADDKMVQALCTYMFMSGFFYQKSNIDLDKFGANKYVEVLVDAVRSPTPVGETANNSGVPLFTEEQKDAVGEALLVALPEFFPGWDQNELSKREMDVTGAICWSIGRRACQSIEDSMTLDQLFQQEWVGDVEA